MTLSKSISIYILAIGISLLVSFGFVFQAIRNKNDLLLNQRVSLVSERIAKIKNKLRQVNADLEALAYFFKASNFIDNGEFQSFAGHILRRNDYLGTCFHDSGLEVQYSVREGKSNVACGEFDYLQPTRAITKPDLHIIQSNFVKTLGAQSGYSSIVFSANSLVPEFDKSDIEDYFVVYDRANTRFYSLKISEQKSMTISPVDKVTLPDRADYSYHKVGGIGDVELLYVVSLANSKSANITEPIYVELMLVFLILGSLLGYLLDKARNSKELVVRKVIERTSELSKAKKEAEAANAHKSMFLANMSHEIRTPLNGIIGVTELIMEKTTDEVLRGELSTIANSGDLLLHVVNDILDFSKLEADKLDLAPYPVSLKSVGRDIVDLHKGTAEKKGVSLELHIEKESFDHFLVDGFRLKQALTNLVGNALKFTKKGKVGIVISEVKQHNRDLDGSEANRRLIRFDIKDTGIGISQTKARSLFKAFSQADASTTRSYGGTGLGLAISQRIIGLMGSKIKLDSNIGEGSNFHFILDLPEAEKVEKADEGLAVLGLGDGLDLKDRVRNSRDYIKEKGLVVLVVEDNKTNQIVIRGLLRKFGFKIEIAQNGLEAVHMVEKNPETYAVVFMDCHMPVLDGFQATIRIRKRISGIDLPIVGCTASVTKEDLDRCFAVGMDAVVGKPIKQNKVLSSLVKVGLLGEFNPDSTDLTG